MRRVIAGAVLAVVGAVFFPAPAHAATVSVPASIDAHGRRDVTDALTQFLAGVADGTTVAFPRDARFRVEGVLVLDALKDVTIDGNGAELFAETDGAALTPPARRYRARWPRLREHVALQDAANVTIRNLTITGPNDDGGYAAALEGQAGFAVYRSTKVTLDDVTVRRTYGDGVYLAGGSQKVTIKNSRFTTIGRQGVAPVYASDVTIEGNHLDGIARSAFDIEPAVPRWIVDKVTIQNNDIGAYRNFLLAAGGAGAAVSNVRLDANHVTGGNGLAVFAGTEGWTRAGLAITDNTSTVESKQVEGEQRAGVMQISRIEGLEITGNRTAIERGRPAITLAGVCNADVRDNEFPGASRETVSTGDCVPGADTTTRPRRTTAPGGSRPARPRPTHSGGPAGQAARGASRGDVSGPDWLIAAGLGVLAVAAFGFLRWRSRAPDRSA
jgi:hypothetical protein